MRLEMLEMAGEVGVKWTGMLLNVCMQEARTPKEWRMGLIVPIWKGRDGGAEELDIETGEDRQEKNGGVKGRDGGAEELDIETGEDR